MTDPQQQEQRFQKRLRSTGSDVEIKESGDGTEGATIRIPVSSTAEDRDGDQFSEDGLEDMRDQLASGKVPMMLDHGRGSDGGYYGTLGIVGRWDGGEIVDDGGHKVLIGEGTLNPANEDADQLREYLDADMPVGASVGFRILEYDHDRDESQYTFHAVDLLETSLVGIPSNPMTVNDGPDAGVATLAKAYSAGNLDGDVFARTVASITGADEEQLRGALNDTDQRHMTDDPSGGDDPANDNTDLLERVVSLQETAAKQLEEQTDRLDEFEERLDAVESGDEKNTDAGEGDDPTDDGTDKDAPEDDRPETVELFVGDDADDDVRKEFEALKDYANDDGTVDLAEPDTTLFAEGDDDGEDEQDATTAARSLLRSD